MKNSEKLIFIDYLKVFSMLYIVGYWHVFDYTDFLPRNLYPISEKITLIALGLFTLISGFLNGKSVMTSPGIKDFYVKRLVRIYPLYLVAVILFFVYKQNDGLTSLKSLFLVSMLHGPAPRTLWFITMIMLFYLTTPFLVRLAKNLKNYILFTGLTMVLMTILMVVFKTIDIRLILYFPCFFVGVYSAIFDMENSLFNIKNAVVSLIIALILYMINTDLWTIEKLKEIPFILSSSYLIFVLSYRKRDFFTRTSLILFLSYSSYAMYLFHRPIYITMKAFYFPEAGIHQLLYLLGFCLLLVTLVSWSLQQVGDKLYVAAKNWL